MRSIILTLSKKIAERKGLHGLDHVFEPPAIGALIAVGVHLTVAADEGKSVRRRRIRPPVRGDAHVIMFVARGRREIFFGYGWRLYIERPLRFGLKFGKCRVKSRITILQPFFCSDQAVRIQNQQVR